MPTPRLTPNPRARWPVAALAVSLLALGCADATLSSGNELRSAPDVGTDPGLAHPAPPSFGSPGPGEQPDEPGAPPSGGDPPLGNAPPESPPPEPLRLVIESPERGLRTDDRTVHVVGRVTGGAGPVTLEVAGAVVVPGPDGSFSTEFDVPPGLSAITSVAVSGSETVDDRRALLRGANDNPRDELKRAIGVLLTPAGLDAIGKLLSEYVAGLDFKALIGPNLPDNMRLRELRFSRIHIRLIPRDGILEVQLEIHDLYVELSGSQRVVVATVNFTGSARANPAQIKAGLRLTATPAGGLDIDVVNPEVNLRDFSFDIRNVPGVVEGWFSGIVRGLAEDLIRDALRDFVVPALFDPDSLTRTIEILGRDLTLGLKIDAVNVKPSGVDLRMRGAARAEAVVHAGKALPGDTRAPSAQADGHLALSLAAGFISRILHAAWAGGVLDFELGPDSGIDLPIPLSLALLAPSLGDAMEGIDRTAPLVIKTRPLLPPQARIVDGDKPLEIEIGDLLLDIGTPDETVVTVSAHIIAHASLAIGDDLEITPEFTVEVRCDVAETPRGPVNDARLEETIERLAAVIPGLIADQTFAFGTDALPVPLNLADTHVSGEDPYIKLTARVQIP